MMYSEEPDNHAVRIMTAATFRNPAGSSLAGFALIVCLTAVAMTSEACHAADARVVINEIFYHAPNDLEDLQYIELHNPGDQAVDLSGWAFTKGIKFKFTAGTRIEAGGFLVLCRDADRFKEFYTAPVAGVFDSALSHKGERIELTDASHKVVDTVKYQDNSPWPTGADGNSGSLERISPAASGDDASNWASSPLAEKRDKPTGTPGKANTCFSVELPPVIASVKFTPEHPSPWQSIAVEAEMAAAKPLRDVNLLYRLAGPGFERPEISVAMSKISEGRYSAMIPGQTNGQLIRFRIQAIGVTGAKRFFPAETEPRPALSSYVHDPIEPAKIPFGWIIHTSESEFKSAQQRANSPGFGGFGGFGPGGFGGGRGGPQGFGGPGAIDPEEQARSKARTTLERGLDLSMAWFELTVKAATNSTSISKLKPLFVAKLAERNKLIQEFHAGGKIDEKLKTLPDVMKQFLSGIDEAARPLLTAGQQKSFAAALERQTSDAAGGWIARMINTRADLEGVWHALTFNTDFDEARLGEVRKSLLQLDEQRHALIAEGASGKGQDDRFRDLRDRAETLGDKMVSTLKPLLTPSQEKAFDAWRSGPREVAVGFRPAPVTADTGGRGFGGPPGGFEGRGGFGGFGGRGRGGRTPAETASSLSAFLYFDPATRKLDLFDFVQIAPRKGGQKVHFHRDRLLKGMTTINLIYEGETAVLVEPLAYEVYRRVGMAAEQSYHIRLWQSGQPAGFTLLVEQPNRAFLRRNKIQDDGNLYKILWYENGVVGQHEKKTHLREGHDDVVSLIDALNKTSRPEQAAEQWEFIRKNFDVEQVANYFAVNMVLSHWDGFFNNYDTYHDIKGTGKWTMYPWDQDNTWGIGRGGGQVFFNMAITFGMNGDVPPGRAPGAGQDRGFGFGGGGGGGSWRPPGWFSGPLLANPQFRKIFLARTREILEKTYTEEVFLPVIAEMGEKLKPEVRLRAELFKGDPERAQQNLERNLQSLREHLRKRREFLLAQDEIKQVASAAKR